MSKILSFGKGLSTQIKQEIPTDRERERERERERQRDRDRETHTPINPFPHDKILDQIKLKAFADDKLNVTKIIISVFDRVENYVRKVEIACTNNFYFSHNVFKRLLS